MKLNNDYRIIITFLLTILTGLSFACQKPATQNSNSAAVNAPSENVATVKTIKPESPTEAYKMLYEAVKAKDTEKIKQLVTKSTEGMAHFLAAQQKQPVEKIYENGFTATVFAPTLPEMRDERIKENFGALEVYSQKDNKWEDLPFMFEDDGWRLAIGDVFQNKYVSPGKGEAQIELDASNKTIPVETANSNKKTAAQNDMINRIPSANISKNPLPAVNTPKK